MSNVWLEKLSWIAEKNANDNVPIKIHLVYFYDEGYMQKISQQTSQQYFEQYPNLKKELANKVEVREFDVMPGTAQDTLVVTPSKCNAKGAVLFARYNMSNVNQKYIIGEDFDLRIIFKRDHIELIKDSQAG